MRDQATCNTCGRSYLSDLEGCAGRCGSCDADHGRRVRREEVSRVAVKERRARLFDDGLSDSEVAQREGISYQRARQLRRELEKARKTGFPATFGWPPRDS